MKRVLQVWIQEYRNILSDKAALLVFFGAILLYPIVYPIPYLPEVVREVPLAVVDLDHSQASRTLIRMVNASESVAVAMMPDNLAQAEDAFYRGQVFGVLVISNDFNKTLLQGKQANVSVYADASYFLVYRTVMTGVVKSSRYFAAGIEIKRLMASGLSQNKAMAVRDPVELISVPLFNAFGGYASYVVPAVLILLLQQTLLIGTGLLGGTAREQQNARFFFHNGKRSASVFPVIIGKTIAYGSLYMVHALYYFSVVYRFYNFPLRSQPFEIFWFLLPFLLSVTLLGLALSTLFKSRETSMLLLVFTSIPILFLAGFSWPVECIPEWLRALSLLLPSTPGISGLIKMNQMGASLQEVKSEWFMLWGQCALYFVLASICFNRMARRIRE
jgi:ABC-2 type transport system permease protein